MKVLHTSDLHIGKQLLKLRLTDIHKSFFNFLIKSIVDNDVDLLLISGDIFDNRTPSPTSQALFYEFLFNLVTTTNIKDVVIISGNHDSKQVVSLVAPLLTSFKIHIITSSNVEDELLILKDKNNEPYVQILAVPFLSDMDLRTNFEAKSASDLENEIEVELTSHFNKCEVAINEKFDKTLPIIGMAHLFSSGGSVNIDKGDGVRDIYVGKLNTLPSKAFPPSLDYLALGHIHKPQIINKDDRLTYCGSPIQLGFGERSNKGMVLLDFNKKEFIKTIIKTPTFISLCQAKGNSYEEIVNKIKIFEATLDEEDMQKLTYLEIIYSGKKIDPNLDTKLNEYILSLEKKYEILSMKIENSKLVLTNTSQFIALSMLSPKEIFTEIIKDSLDDEVISLFDVVMEEVQL
ncbi:MAG: exonuclease subunit SbcD [Spirochaetaceae bacterium]|nr:exonuclease subunit SbcD [Spirochaetaceae bacterium]